MLTRDYSFLLCKRMKELRKKKGVRIELGPTESQSHVIPLDLFSGKLEKMLEVSFLPFSRTFKSAANFSTL